MPEIWHIAFCIITSRKGDDMKQGVFWIIDNKLLAIPFDKSKYPDLDAVKQQCKIEMDDETKEIKSFVISKHIPKYMVISL